MSNFRFTKEAPSQDLLNDLQNLGTMSDDLFDELVDLLLNYLSQEEDSDLRSAIQNLSKKHSFNIGSLAKIVKSSLFFFENAIRSNLTPLYLKEDLTNFGISEERGDATASKWRQKIVQLSRTVIETQTLMINNLVDMEWKFGVTASSSDLGRVRSTFLQLKLVVDKGNNTTENIYMELTLPQFYEFLQEMQKAKANLEIFSG